MRNGQGKRRVTKHLVLEMGQAGKAYLRGDLSRQRKQSALWLWGKELLSYF
jgi:hypothetical protein